MSKKHFVVIYFVLSFLAISNAQINTPKSYALVIGVSKYNDSKIESLKHANKDAAAFAEFCASSSGLNIPADRLRILIDEEATYYNIVNGLDWLKNNAQRNDQVYIYFAGHGDMESEELQYGYLLAHDSRHMNYLGRSLSLDLLNKTAHTLTVNKKAKAFLITDACHSGKLAGVDFNGSNLVALNLMKLVSNNEVRITSCSEDEKSYEDEVWGNGRGAFSYFLTKGMSGEADGVNGKKDGSITIGEIKSFLSGKVPNEVRTIKSKKQNPVVMGAETSILKPFKPMTGLQNNSIAAQQTNEISSGSGSRSVSGQLFKVLEIDILNSVDTIIKDKNIDFKVIASKSSSDIMGVFLEDLIKSKKHSKKTLSSAQSQLIVAKALFNDVQHIIDLYLNGDEAELERRRYYSEVDKPYDQYPYMLEIAIKLLPKDHLLIPSLQMQKEYLIGLSYRLKMPFTKDYMRMVDTALVYQQKALALDSTAAYIHNELGILHLYNKNLELSKYHFEKANIIAPMWSLPYSNLANLALKNKDDITAKKYVDLALKKQENFQNPYIIDGNIYMNSNNLLFAEEQYQRALKINDRHFLPFDKLADLYLKVQDYQTSEIYYYECAIRKIGLINGSLDIAAEPPSQSLPETDHDKDGLIPMLIYEKDIFRDFAMAKNYFDKREYAIAQEWFEGVINMDADNPLAYHYIGQTAYHFKDFAKAELYFKKALDFYLDDEDFKKHVEEMKGLYTELPDDFYLVEQKYKDSHFDIYDPTIYLARTYEKWGYFALAAAQYKECLNLDSLNKIAYQMLWNMYKNRKELESAESVMYKFGQTYPNDLDRVLADFYEWGLEIFKEDVQKTEYYAYKYGLLLYEIAKESPETYFASFERSFPNSDEKFADSEV